MFGNVQHGQWSGVLDYTLGMYRGQGDEWRTSQSGLYIMLLAVLWNIAMEENGYFSQQPEAGCKVDDK